jgi:hypothetical protein
VISRNVIAGGSAGRYPADNSYPSPAQFESQFAGYAAGDYRLIASSPWRGAATDGGDLGVMYDGAAAPRPPSQQPIEGEGVITGGVSGTACPALQFTVGTYRVAVDGSTQFSGGSCANLVVGTRIRARGVVGTDGTVSLSEVAILSSGWSNRTAEGRGVVTAVVPASTCASGGVLIAGYTVMIDSATQFTSGACTDVSAGVTLEVAGYFVSETVVRASGSASFARM